MQEGLVGVFQLSLAPFTQLLPPTDIQHIPLIPTVNIKQMNNEEDVWKICRTAHILKSSGCLKCSGFGGEFGACLSHCWLWEFWPEASVNKWDADLIVFSVTGQVEFSPAMPERALIGGKNKVISVKHE